MLWRGANRAGVDYRLAHRWLRGQVGPAPVQIYNNSGRREAAEARGSSEPRCPALYPILQAHPFDALPGSVFFTSAVIAFDHLHQLIADGVRQSIWTCEVVQGLIVDEPGYFDTRHA